MGLDSVELIMEIEKAFEISIQDEEAQKIITVGDIYNCTWSYINKRKEANKKEMETIINQIIHDKIGVELKEISPEKKIIDDFGID
jgi:acyl carrier protein